MHIGIAGPIATSDISALLDGPVERLPRGYVGAPLLTTLIGELIRRGHQVTAFTLSSDLPLRDDATVVAKGQALQVHYVPMRLRAWPMNGWRPGRIVDLYRFERRSLVRAIAAARPDVIHAHWAYEFAWAALTSGLPHVITSHDSPFVIARYFRGFKLGGYRRLRAAMAWHVLRQARHVTTVSPYMVDQIQPLCRVPVALVPNPIADQAFAQQRETEPERMRVMMVCNGWDQRKNGETALRAFAQLSQVLPGVQLVVCGFGFGPGEQASQWWASQGFQGDVCFLGGISHAAILREMARSDVLLHPALEESFGAVVAEAMAVGLPVVAGVRSGAVPWVAGDAGQLVDVADPDAIAGALLGLFESPQRMSRMAERGQAQASSRFGAKAVSALYEDAYRYSISAACPAIAGVPT
jgi:L-malate glycosyltransferase